MGTEPMTRADPPNLTIEHARVYDEKWTLRKPFAIARGTATDVTVVMVELKGAGHTGRGECCPVAHYGESTQSVLQAIETMLTALRSGAEWDRVHDTFPAGAARNAVDCAIWDLRAKQSGRPVWALLGMPEPHKVETVFTIGLGDAADMAQAASEARAHGILKIKLGRPGDAERIRAIRAAVPDKRLIVDVNEGWSPDELPANLQAMADAGVLMVEQPLKAGADATLAGLSRPVIIGADESCHVSADIDRLIGSYNLVNIKLDKTGGLTEALRLLQRAQQAGLETMVGCMLGTSLAMAPALLIAQSCRFVDLDAPLLIGNDRDPSLTYADGFVHPSTSQLWG